MISLRLATANDIEAICSFDHIAQQETQRREFITRSVVAVHCHVAVAGDQIAGYGVLEHSFFGYAFISMLYVHPDYRRRGVGTKLMQHLQSLCSTSKLFTSTNLSNLPMQSLLARLGYALSGVVHNIDEGDPELIYFKPL
jgi:ribosomal protein S18 acetylase RimI-like enzyme